MILFTETVLEEVNQAIAQKEPEQGGTLLGAPDSNLISHFIYDEAARTTSVTYRPSKSLIQAVKEREQTDGLQFKVLSIPILVHWIILLLKTIIPLLRS